MKIISSDIELVVRLKKGDVEAFDMLYGRYSGKLYSFGMKYLKSKEEAEELVQSVFLKLWENHKLLKTDTSFKSYLFTIAYNDICKLFRKRTYQQKFISDILYENSQSSSDTENEIDYHSEINRVQQIIEKLTERQRTIFLKSRWEGKSTKEIAAELNLSPGTVDNYISETLKIIRFRMRSQEFSVLLYLSIFFL